MPPFKSPLKLAFLCHEFPPMGGGAATALDALTQNLASLGHDVTVFTMGPKTGFSPSTSLPNRSVVSLGDIRKNPFCPSLKEFLHSYFLLRFKAPFHLKKLKPDVVISFFAFPTGHALLPFMKRSKIPHVVSIRGVDAPGFREDRFFGLSQILMPFLIKPVLSHAQLIYTNGQRLKHLVEKTFKDLSVISLPNGVKLPSPLPSFKRKFKSLNIIFVGQFVERKRVLETLEGVLLFARTTSEKIIFTLVGAGDLEKDLRKLASKAPSNLTILFKGYMERSDIFSLYKDQHVMVHLSHDEGVSNTFLEALAHGLAFLVSPSTVYDMDLSESFPGQILSSFTPEDISQGLKDLFSSQKDLEEKFLTSSRLAHNFSWDIHTQKFLHHMEKLL